MRDVFHWAFIGAGTLARQVAKEITATGRHKVVSVYTHNPEKCREFADAWHAHADASSEEAMLHPGVDGVYIVTPHTSHADYALQAISLGIPVLCEKPFSTDSQKTGEALQLARERHVYCAEAMWSWFSPIAQQMKAWYDAGEYGDIQKFCMTYHLKSIHYAPRVSDPMLAGGALLDIGIYPLTYAYRLMGYPDRIECQGNLQGGIDTGETILLSWKDGRRCEIDVSIMDFRGLEKLTLKGTKGSTKLWFYHSANHVSLHRRHGQTARLSASGGYVNEFDCVAREIRDGLTESLLVPHSATLDVMRIMDECRRQMGLVYPFESDPG